MASISLTEKSTTTYLNKNSFNCGKCFSFSQVNYLYGVTINLSHLMLWGKNLLFFFLVVLKHPVIMNDEIGEISLSFLSKNLKFTNSKDHLKNLRRYYVLF